MAKKEHIVSYTEKELQAMLERTEMKFIAYTCGYLS